MRFIITFIAILTSTNVICQDNNLLRYENIFNNQLKPWTSTFSDFKLTDFKANPTKPFESNYKHDFKDLSSFYAIYKPILTFSPDSLSFIDIYSYQLNLEKKDVGFKATIDVDQAIMLCDAKSKYWDRICFGPLLFITRRRFGSTLQSSFSWQLTGLRKIEKHHVFLLGTRLHNNWFVLQIRMPPVNKRTRDIDPIN